MRPPKLLSIQKLATTKQLLNLVFPSPVQAGDIYHIPAATLPGKLVRQSKGKRGPISLPGCGPCCTVLEAGWPLWNRFATGIELPLKC